MNLFRYEGFKVVISPESLLLKPFKRIWDRDKSKDKTKALSELGFVYFYCDPRSEYMIYMDEGIRLEEIKKAEGMKDSWVPDKQVLEAMKLYKQLTVTTAAGLLEDARFGINKIREQLRSLSYDEIDPAKLPKALKDATDTLMKIPDLIKAFQQAEQALNSEILENSRMRGQGNSTIFEEGFEDGNNDRGAEQIS